MRIGNNFNLSIPILPKKENRKHYSPQNNSKITYLSQSYSKIDIENEIRKKEVLFENFLLKKGKVDFKEYCYIKKNYPFFITKAYKYYEQFKKEKEQERRMLSKEYFKKDPTETEQELIECFIKIFTEPKDAAKCALTLKKTYDNDYGKKNYRIISVGTSPAFITQIMPSLGCEVIYLPISNISDGVEKANSTKLSQISKYLKDKGINNEKTNIILDYVNNGGSIYNCKRIIEQLGIDKDKIVLSSLFDELANSDNYKEEELEKIFYDVAYEKVENFSNVPHFDVQTKEDTQLYHKQIKDFEQYSKKIARAFSLCALFELDNIMHKKNPRISLD